MWISVKDRLPPAGHSVQFLCEVDGKHLSECYGYKATDDEDNLMWFDITSTDRDGDPWDIWTVRYWLEAPPHPKLD